MDKTYSQSKKARSTLITQAGIALMVGGVLVASGGDPVKAEGLTQAVMPLATLFITAGIGHVLIQGGVDGVKASKGSEK